MADAAYVQRIYLECFGAALFSLVFLFLWKQSGVIYFAYWSVAWAVEALAAVSTELASLTQWPHWLAIHSFLEFGFALSLVAAARVGSTERNQSWRSALRVLYFLPAFVFVLELFEGHRHAGFLAVRSLVLGLIYFYSFRQLAQGFQVKSRRLFHLTLLALSLLYLHCFPAYLFIQWTHGIVPAWMAYMSYIGYVDLALKTVLAFSAMAMWIENQNDRVSQIARELDRVRREAAHDGSLDYLTGLANPDSLRKRIDLEDSFKGVAAVCDLDEFKIINDRFGHVVGDEVLRNVGNLLRSSIRAEDIAYRWGGDEFAILFRDQEPRHARDRMAAIEARLGDFRVRGHTSLQISFSWGVAEGNGVPLRTVLEQADREMYATKRARAAARPLPENL
jgi:diguanylate cyclase (GGDEF)-like protein